VAAAAAAKAPVSQPLPQSSDDVTRVMVSIHQHQVLTSGPFVFIIEGKSIKDFK